MGTGRDDQGRYIRVLSGFSFAVGGNQKSSNGPMPLLRGLSLKCSWFDRMVFSGGTAGGSDVRMFGFGNRRLYPDERCTRVSGDGQHCNLQQCSE
jgi:hypothetical protein